jgi:hypothetical protein
LASTTHVYNTSHVGRLSIPAFFVFVSAFSLLLPVIWPEYSACGLLAVGLSYCVLLIFHFRAERSEYREIYNDYGALAALYTNAYAFIRFILFARELSVKQITHAQVSEAESLLDLEEKTSGSFFSNNFITVSLVGLLTAITAGAASTETAWKGGYIPFVIMLILLCGLINVMIYPFGRQKKRSELRRFLHWYRCAPEDTWTTSPRP